MLADSHVACILPTRNHPDRKLRLLDMTKEELASDKSTICEDSAVEYSVGYIHHLFKVRELLEPILLTKHNMEQMELFIQLIRNGSWKKYNFNFSRTWVFLEFGYFLEFDEKIG